MVWAGALAAALGSAHYYGLNLSGPNKAVVPGYGTDPDLLNPVVPWPRVMTASQQAATKVFVDFILPHEGGAPSASDVGVHELIDEWISAPYPDQAKDNALVLDGLAQMDFQARRRSGAKAFSEAPRDVQTEILADFANPAKATAAKDFYKRLRTLVVGAYYTTEAGFADIGYVGNMALKVFPEPSPEVLAAVERACQQLGLVDAIVPKA
ncbi:MAG: gluconate 2-dehydrogenase subunit 3 family protein [Sphingomonadales bacterium]|nr:MAG: gluconate 2-dehydrogenase subunit 3 family protein [Sphingomonadales bacterium]